MFRGSGSVEAAEKLLSKLTARWMDFLFTAAMAEKFFRGRFASLALRNCFIADLLLRVR